LLRKRPGVTLERKMLSINGIGIKAGRVGRAAFFTGT
jgi:hypothetical protein